MHNEINISFMDSKIQNRFYSYLRSKFIEMDEFEDAFSHLDSSSQKVFISKWGLDGTSFCDSFKCLDKKLRKVYTKELYMCADSQLSQYHFTKFFFNFGTISFDSMVAYGRLINDIFYDYLPNKRRLFGKIDLVNFQKQMEHLALISYSIICDFYGISGIQLNLPELSKKFCLSKFHVVQILSNSRRNLFNMRKKYISTEGEKNET